MTKVHRAKVHAHKRDDRQEAQSAQGEHDGIVAPPAGNQANLPSVRALDCAGCSRSQFKCPHQIIDLLAALEIASTTSTKTMVTRITRPAQS